MGYNYQIIIEYDGSKFVGWQYQKNGTSIQEVLEKKLKKIFKKKVKVIGAGRTDAGVHAKQMYAHFDTDQILDCEKIQYRLNSYLCDAIHIKSIFLVSDNAHARFDAIARVYEYWLCQHKNPFLKDAAWLLYSNLDFDVMNVAAKFLIEVNDFTSFSKLHTDVNTHICDVRKAEWEQRGDIWVFSIEADRFLRNMVRAIVGTLVDVGKGKITVNEFKDIVAKMDRSAAGVSAPAKGLYLLSINYPNELLDGNS